MSTQPRLQRWERRSEWPLTAAALVFLVAYAVPISNAGLDGDKSEGLRVVTGAAWRYSWWTTWSGWP